MRFNILGNIVYHQIGFFEFHKFGGALGCNWFEFNFNVLK